MMMNGVDCVCMAHHENECGCDADWTTSEVRQLENRVAELEAVLGLVKKDLLLRAEHDDYGVEIVGLSSSVWLKLSNFLKEQDNG
jgi:hypothetical protein